MNQPRYSEELFKLIFLWLGVAFVFMGFLCLIGVLKPEASSMARETTVMGMAFSSLGIAFFIVQTVLKAIALSKNKQHNELLASGTKVYGNVEKVYLQRYLRYGSKSPYRILYCYTAQGKVYHHRSNLLWDKPGLMEGDAIVVYTNNFEKSTVQL